MDNKTRREHLKDLIQWKARDGTWPIASVTSYQSSDGVVGFNMLSVKDANDIDEFYWSITYSIDPLYELSRRQSVARALNGE